MVGLLTEKDFKESEKEAVFKGMKRFYHSLDKKPRTFVELTWMWINRPCLAPLAGVVVETSEGNER